MGGYVKRGELEKEIEISGKMVEIRRFFELKMMMVNDYEPSMLRELEEIAISNECDIIRIRNCEKLDGYFFKPTRIGLYRSLDGDIDLEGIPKSKRNCIKNALNIFSFSVTNDMNGPEFKEWFKIYKKRMEEIDKGIEILSNEWLNGKDTALAFARKGDEIIGGYIIMMKKEGGIIPSLAFGSSKNEFFKDGINDFIIWNIMKWLKSKEHKKMKFGVDTNFYGFHLSPGIFIYKKSWGFCPKASGDMECLKILNFSKFGDIIFFMTGKDELEGNLLLREGVKFDEKRLLSKSIKKVSIFRFDKNSLLTTD
jgi:hypothetical protein